MDSSAEPLKTGHHMTKGPQLGGAAGEPQHNCVMNHDTVLRRTGAQQTGRLDVIAELQVQLFSDRALLSFWPSSPVGIIPFFFMRSIASLFDIQERRHFFRLHGTYRHNVGRLRFFNKGTSNMTASNMTAELDLNGVLRKSTIRHSFIGLMVGSEYCPSVPTENVVAIKRTLRLGTGISL